MDPIAKKRSFRLNLAILSAVLVCESVSATVLMPFVGYFIAHLQHISPNDAGYLSGILVSVFQLGQMLTGALWGAASDRVGRKPMIQMGLLANAIAASFFGISPNIYFCVIMRFIHGCANGTTLVAKSVIADITDKSTEAAGFAAMSIFWGVGSAVGPAIGGIFYDPAHTRIIPSFLMNAENSDNPFFAHPAFLPCFLISVFSLITLALISAVLPETSATPVEPFYALFTRSSAASSPNAKVKEDALPPTVTTVAAVKTVESTDDFNAPCGADTTTAAPSGVLHTDEDHTFRFGDGADDSQRAGDRVGGRSPDTSALSPREAQRKSSNTSRDVTSGLTKRIGSGAATPVTSSLSVPSVKDTSSSGGASNIDVDAWTHFGYREVFLLPSSRYVLIMYMCIAAAECALLEVTPLWAIASPSLGGLAMSSSDCGWMLGVSSLVCVAANLFFDQATRAFGGSQQLWDWSVMFWAVTNVVTPFTVFVRRERTFAVCTLMLALRQIGLSLAYSINYMFVVRAAPDRFVGSMNGCAQAIASGARMVTMLVIPPIFAWSLNGVKNPFPFNYHFTFWLSNVPLLLSFLMSSRLPPRVTEGRDAGDAPHTNRD